MSTKLEIRQEYTEVFHGTAEKELKRVKKEGCKIYMLLFFLKNKNVSELTYYGNNFLFMQDLSTNNSMYLKRGSEMNDPDIVKYW